MGALVREAEEVVVVVVVHMGGRQWLGRDPVWTGLEEEGREVQGIRHAFVVPAEGSAGVEEEEEGEVVLENARDDFRTGWEAEEVG